jgi:hypothetical protein
MIDSGPQPQVGPLADVRAGTNPGPVRTLDLVLIRVARRGIAANIRSIAIWPSTSMFENSL